MFDIFYVGTKPNLFAFEKPAATIEHAAEQSRTEFFWFIHGDNDYIGFDFNWMPPPWEHEYTHVFPSQWHANGGVYFANKDSVDVGKLKFQTAQSVKRKADMSNWIVPLDVDVSHFDFTWHPNPLELPYEYIFGTQWQQTGGPVYKGTAGKKFVSTQKAVSQVDLSKWIIPANVDDSMFDYSWHPDNTEPDYEYVFGTQWQVEGGPVYKGTAGKKYVSTQTVKSTYVDISKWVVPTNIDIDSFDFTWHPNPTDLPYEYVFGTQWQKEGGPVYKGTAGKKFIKDQFAVCNAVDMTKWIVPADVDVSEFDFTWHPEASELPYEYIFGTQWQRTGGPVYKGTAGKKYVNTQHARAIVVDMTKWILPTDVDVSKFDFTWHPDKDDLDYEYVFGTQWQRTGGPVYKGTAGKKYVSTQHATATHIDMDRWMVPDNIDQEQFDFTWHPDVNDPDYEYHFPTQWQRAGGPVYKGTAGKKFLNKPRAVAVPDMSKWFVPDNIDVSGFDFSWHSNPNEPDYEYHFPTQWQKEGGPVYKGTAGVKYTTAQKIRVNATQIFYMDFLNPGSKEQFEKLKLKWPDIKSTRYVDNHLNVFKRIVAQAETEFVWIVSSVCDYSDFDFTWHPESFQSDMIHVFPSGGQKRGDTFYINVASFKTQMYDLEILDWFNVINYCDDQSVDRMPAPNCIYDHDNLVEEVRNFEFKFPYAIFANQADLQMSYNICLWSEKDRSVESFTRSNSICVVPRDVKAHLRTQIYDYPYVKGEEQTFFAEKKLDIIYISNGEPEELRWWNWLIEHSRGSNIKWIQNVNGRANAYRAAASASRTPWFFTVFGKLEIDPTFDWTWQPDYFQEPKHYIFNARNPVNGLVYGHQAMIAYNKRLVLDTLDSGLDFTLSKAHESVPIMSGTAHFNIDPWTTWRTAFREVVKLKHFSVTQPSVETDYRLKVWCNKAEGSNAEWALNGAKDAIEYYDSVNGDFGKLMLTYEWDWLRKYFDSKY